MVLYLYPSTHLSLQLPSHHGMACVGEGFRSEQLHEELQRPVRQELAVPAGAGGFNRTQSGGLDLCQEVCCDDDDDDDDN